MYDASLESTFHVCYFFLDIPIRNGKKKTAAPAKAITTMHVAITAKAASEQANIFLKVVVFKNFPLANFLPVVLLALLLLVCVQQMGQVHEYL